MSVFSKPRPTLQAGDHIWYHTHGGLVQHHAIYVRHDHVIHFDDEDTDARYGHCDECTQLLQRRRRRGRGRYVRYSCLTCWRLGKKTTNFYTCEYGVSRLYLLAREAGSCSMERSHPGHLVVERARWYFENDKFGHWELFTRNCEDFSRFCKILKLGSKQSTRAILILAAARGIVVRTVLSITILMGLRTWWRAEQLRDLPPNLRLAW